MAIHLFPEGCPVCEQKTPTTKHCTMDGYDYVQCQVCGLVYQEGTTDISTITACYTGGPLKHLRRQLLNRFRKIERQRDFVKRMTRAREIFNFASNKVSLEKGDYLDIGCNKGFNIYASEEKGWRGFGNELIEEILIPIQNSKPHLRERLKTGSFVELGPTYTNDSFDLITCIDVIEHLLEPKKALQDMYRIVKPGGAVILQTCDATPDKLEMRADWGALKPNEHLLLFNQDNFETMAKNAGFDKVEYAPQPFDECDGNFVVTCWKN